METIGQRIAAEFTRDKVSLTEPEQRRLAQIIDGEIGPKVDPARPCEGVELKCDPDDAGKWNQCADFYIDGVFAGTAWSWRKGLDNDPPDDPAILITVARPWITRELAERLRDEVRAKRRESEGPKPRWKHRYEGAIFLGNFLDGYDYWLTADRRNTVRVYDDTCDGGPVPISLGHKSNRHQEAADLARAKGLIPAEPKPEPDAKDIGMRVVNTRSGKPDQIQVYRDGKWINVPRVEL